MASKIKVTRQKVEMLEKEGPETPLLDLSDAAVKALIDSETRDRWQSAEQDDGVHRDPHVLVVPWEKTPSKRPRDILPPAATSSHPDPRPIRAETRAKLVTAIAKGRYWLDELIAGTVTNVEQIAAAETCTIRPDQYDDITRVFGSEPGAGRSRRAPAPWNRHRESARCANRMVPAIRQARARLPSLDVAAPGTEFSRPETRVRIRLIPPAGDRMMKITRRTGRANAARSHKVPVTRDLGGCVVADAVPVEPVSTLKFPANREINREFCQIGPLGAILKADTRANSEA